MLVRVRVRACFRWQRAGLLGEAGAGASGLCVACARARVLAHSVVSGVHCARGRAPLDVVSAASAPGGERPRMPLRG